MTSIIASTVLCASGNGVLLDTESREFVSAGAALEWGKRAEAEIRRDLVGRRRSPTRTR
jgi:hypothetical protein